MSDGDVRMGFVCGLISLRSKNSYRQLTLQWKAASGRFFLNGLVVVELQVFRPPNSVQLAGMRVKSPKLSETPQYFRC